MHVQYLAAFYFRDTCKLNPTVVAHNFLEMLSEHLATSVISPVVPALTDSTDGHERVLRGPGLAVVRVVTEHVRGRVHEPGEVQHHAVA